MCALGSSGYDMAPETEKHKQHLIKKWNWVKGRTCLKLSHVSYFLHQAGTSAISLVNTVNCLYFLMVLDPIFMCTHAKLAPLNQVVKDSAKCHSGCAIKQTNFQEAMLVWNVKQRPNDSFRQLFLIHKSKN